MAIRETLRSTFRKSAQIVVITGLLFAISGSTRLYAQAQGRITASAHVVGAETSVSVVTASEESAALTYLASLQSPMTSAITGDKIRRQVGPAVVTSWMVADDEFVDFREIVPISGPWSNGLEPISKPVDVRVVIEFAAN